MARISLLFSFAFTLGLGSLLSASASVAAGQDLSKNSVWHTMLPESVIEVQTLPFVEIQKFLQRKSTFAPKNKEFKAMFDICHDYVSLLQKISSLTKAEQLVLTAVWKAKFVAMNRAVLAAQNSVGVSGKLLKKLRKNYAGMIKGFTEVPAKIAEISLNHLFDANARISLKEQNELRAAMQLLKMSVDDFMDIACEVDEKRTVKVDEKKKKKKKQHERKLTGEDGQSPFFNGKHMPHMLKVPAA